MGRFAPALEQRVQLLPTKGSLASCLPCTYLPSSSIRPVVPILPADLYLCASSCAWSHRYVPLRSGDLPSKLFVLQVNKVVYYLPQLSTDAATRIRSCEGFERICIE